MTTADEQRRYEELRGADPASPEGQARLFAALADESWRVRRAAVGRLVAAAEPRALALRLVALLGDSESVALRNSAAEGLVALGAQAIPALVEAAESADPNVRKFAVDGLGEVRGGEEALVRALEDRESNVRVAAAEALGKLGGERAALRRLVERPPDDPELLLAALDGLARSDAVLPIELLLPLAGRAPLRRPVLRLLGRCGSARAIELLLEGALDGGRAVREAALAGLGRLTGAEIEVCVRRTAERAALRQAALAALQGADPAAARGALRLLACAGVGAAEDAPLAAALAGEELLSEEVLALLLALGPEATLLAAREPGLSPRARPTLLSALARALAGGEGPERSGAEELALRWLDDSSDEGRLAALALLGAIGSERTLPALLAFADGEPDWERPVVETLSAIGRRSPDAFRKLGRAELRGLPRPVTLRLFGAIGAKEDVPALLAVLRAAPGPRQRAAAAEALGTLGDASAERALALALSDEAPEVREAAERALARLGASR